jgi:hypothetical protein
MTQERCIHGLRRIDCDTCSPYSDERRPHATRFVPPPQNTDLRSRRRSDEEQPAAPTHWVVAERADKRGRRRRGRATKKQRKLIEELSGKSPERIPGLSAHAADEIIRLLREGEALWVKRRDGSLATFRPRSDR